MVQLRIVLAEDAGLCDDACPKADEDARPAGRSESEDLHRRKGPETMDFKRFQTVPFADCSWGLQLLQSAA